MPAEIRIKKTEFNIISFEKIIVFIIAVFFSYSAILPNSSRSITLFLICLAGINLFYNLYNKQSSTVQSHSPFFYWLVFLVFVLVDRGPIGFSQNYLTWPINIVCILLFVLLNNRKNNEVIFYFVKIISLIELGNALATIIFWIFPSVYIPYRETFLSNAVRIVNAGYKAGLTTHYSTNGLLLCYGLISSFALYPLNKKKYGFFMVLYLFSLILTTKRAHLLFGIASCFFYFWILNRKKEISKWIKYILLIVLFIVIWFIAAQFIPELGATFARFENTEDYSRQSYREICIQLFEKSPLIGNGWNSFTDYLYGTYIGNNLASRGNNAQDAHNVFFQVLAEQGIVGEILFIISLIKTILFDIKLFDRSLDSKNFDDNKHGLVGLSYAIILQTFFILYCMTGNPLYNNDCYIPFFLSIGISVNYFAVYNLEN